MLTILEEPWVFFKFWAFTFAGLLSPKLLFSSNG